VVCGGETGAGARHMDTVWAVDLRDQCRAADTPFFFKQMSGRSMAACKRNIPPELRVQEFPTQMESFKTKKEASCASS